jgi:hypothetical protein
MKKAHAVAALAILPAGLAAPPAADAYNTQTWYTSGGIPANYLPTHMLSAGGYGDFAPSGDYCNDYTGATFNQAIGTDESGLTGYAPPTPYSSYQYGDGYGNVCQANDYMWGNEVRHTAPNNNCWYTCGMQHYVSFQSSDIRPWAGYQFPSLQIRSTFKPHTFTTSGSPAGGWGYVCPVMQDTTTLNMIEFCLEEWQPQPADSQWPKTDVVSQCDTANGGHPFDLTITQLTSSGSNFASSEGGYSTTVIGSMGSFQYSATVTPSQFKKAIQAVNSTCGRNSNTDATNWRILGVEDGQEAWRNYTILGAAHGRLQVNTIY